MPTVTTASAAREKLFALLERVAADPDEIVLIEHRGRKERAALVSERHLRALEMMVAELGKDRKPFKLRGSIKIVGDQDVDEILAEIRAEDARQFEKRLREFAGED